MIYLSNLIPLLNTRVIGIPIRRLLRITDYSHPIVKLEPNSYHVHLGKGTCRAIIYCNNQFIEAVHKNLGWLLGLMHSFDQKIANRYKPAWNLGFDSYSSQPDASAGKDVRLYSIQPDSNQDGGDLAIGESSGATNILRTLIEFDLTSIPSGSSISAATLSLWLYVDAASNARSFRVYRQKRAWIEDEATWNVYSTGNSWQTAGGFGSDDCEQTDMGERSMTASEANGEKQWELDGQSSDYAELEAMCGNSPAFTNYGWLMKADTESNDRYSFRSSDYGTASERPKLVITYTHQPAPSIVGMVVGVGTPSIGLYDTRFKLRARNRDTALTTRVRNE